MTLRRALLLALVLAVTAGCRTPAPSGEPVPPPPAAEAGGEIVPSYPDLRGTWATVLRAIYSGQGPGALEPVGEGAELDYLRLTVSVDIQEGPLFYGTIDSGPDQQPFAGAFRRNGREAIYITREGRGEMWLDPEQPDRIEVCGGRGTADTLMALCGQLDRERR